MKKIFITSIATIITLFSPLSYPILLADNPPSSSTGIVTMTKPIKWFLNIRAPEANITKINGVPVLHLNNPTILGLSMTKEPTKNISLQEFISDKTDNPNAGLNYYANSKMFSKHIILSNPVVNGTILSFNVRTYPASDESNLIVNIPLKNVSLLLDPADPAFFDSTSSK